MMNRTMLVALVVALVLGCDEEPCDGVTVCEPFTYVYCAVWGKSGCQMWMPMTGESCECRAQLRRAWSPEP